MMDETSDEENTLRLQLQESERENAELRAKVADLFQADTVKLLDAKLSMAYKRIDALNATGAAVRAAIQGFQVPNGMELGRGVRLVLAVTKEDARLAKEQMKEDRKDLRRVQKDIHDARQEIADEKEKVVEWRSRYTRDVSGERLDAREIRERVRHERRRERVKVCDELLAFFDGRWSPA